MLTQQIKKLLNYQTLRDRTQQSDQAGIRTRLHIWPHRPLKKQKSDHQIHDHRFDMKSTILMGTMVNRVYEFEEQENGSDEIYGALYKTRHDSTVEPTGVRGHTLCKHIDVARSGECYALRAGLLHSSTAYGYTATFMESLKGYPEMPVRLVIPHGMWVDNDFDRFTANPPEILWEEIKRVCGEVGTHGTVKRRRAYAVAAG
jgi:hypothetical protein